MLRPVLLTLGLLTGAIAVAAPVQAQLRDIPACDWDAFDEAAAQGCVDAAMSGITQTLGGLTSTLRGQLATACKPDDYKPWQAAVGKLDSLVRFIDQAKRRQVLNPFDVQDNEAVNRAVGARFSVADTALSHNCLDIAGEQYQAIRQYGLAISASEQLRALYGIETVRARRPR